MEISETGQWQLRRIGDPATCPTVLDVFPLKHGTVTFGRNHKNDYFLDSRRLKNFISRNHAEITGYYGDNGFEFKIREKGLNGTFINDVRIQGSYILQEGDKVTFGHTNGYKIRPGEYSTQQNSEFEFIFERVPTASALCSQHKLPSIHDYDRSECLQQSCECKHKLHPSANFTSDDHFKNDQSNNTQQVTSTTYISENSLESKHTENNSLTNHPSCNSELSQSESVSKTQFDCELLLNSEGGSKQQEGELDNAKNEKGHERGQQTSVSDNSCDSLDSFNLDGKVDPVNLPNSPESWELPDLDVNQNVFDSSDKVNCDQTKSEEQNFNDQENSQKTLQDIQNTDHMSNRPLMLLGTKFVHEADKAIDKDLCHSSDSSSRKTYLNNKRKKGQSKTRRRKRRNPRSDSESDQLEDGVEWYDNETCASASCTRPTSKRVAWVQCDDCDQWYHTVCADCSYEMVKDSKMQFHCGC